MGGAPRDRDGAAQAPYGQPWKGSYVTRNAWFEYCRTCSTLPVSSPHRSRASTARISTARSSSTGTGTIPMDSGSWTTAPRSGAVGAGSCAGIARRPAAAGVIIGAVLALGVVTGWLHLAAGGIVIVTLLQGIWIILVAAHLLRGGFNGRDV